MKLSIDELVEDYIIKVTRSEQIERDELSLTLEDLLNFQHDFNLTMNILQSEIELKYNVTFDGCDSEGNKILSRLCDEKVKSILHSQNLN